jgi:glutaredoxin
MNDKIPVVIYGDEFCAYCAAARMLLTKKGV